MMRAEDLARLQPPPRETPVAVWWFLRLAPHEGLLFALIVTSLLTAFVAPNADWQSFLFLRGSTSAVGQVVNAEERDGRKETGASHFLGDRPRIGDEVRIEWPPGFPRLARIEGGRTGPLQRGTLFVLLPFWFVLVRLRTAWTTASPRLRGMREGVLIGGAKDPGLVDAATQEMLARPNDIPYGVEVGLDGVWSLPSKSRLFRPSLLALLAAASLGVLVRAFVSMAQLL